MREGERIAERFVLEAPAGSGAMGIVYRARDLATNRVVAVKLLKAADFDSLARFQREAAALASLRHPAIVEYVTHGSTNNGEPFLAMEWLSGTSLKEALDARPFGFIETIDVARGIVAALAAAHATGIVHRDLKPANVFLVHGSPNAVKVVDFGIARLRGAGATLTGTGAMLGTPAFMSPEQARGAKHVDSRSDFFSLGAILFRAITGRTPFEGEDTIMMLLALTTQRAPRVASFEPATPPRLAALVDALLAPTPDERPPNAELVLQALDTARAEAVAVNAGRPSMRFAPSNASPFATNPSVLGAPPSGPAGSSPPMFATGPAAAFPRRPAATAHATHPSHASAAGARWASPATGEPWTAAQPTPPVTPPRGKRTRALLWIALAAAVGLGAAGAALYFAGALDSLIKTSSGGTSKRKKASAKSAPEKTAAPDAPSASAMASAPAAPPAWCPAVAIACAETRVADRHAVALDAVQGDALALARKARPGAEIVRITGTGLTDAGLDLDAGGNITFAMTKGVAVNLHDDHLTSMNNEDILARPLPPCSLMTAYQRARGAGLPAKPSASFIFGEEVNFIVAGTDPIVVQLDPATCQPKKSP